MRVQRLTISVGVLLFGIAALSAFAMTGGAAVGDDTTTVEGIADPGCENVNVPEGGEVCIPDYNDGDTVDDEQIEIPDSDEIEFDDPCDNPQTETLDCSEVDYEIEDDGDFNVDPCDNPQTETADCGGQDIEITKDDVIDCASVS